METLKRVLMLSFIIAFVFAVDAYANDGMKDGSDHMKSASDTITYTTHIKPVFEEKCAGCHGAGSPEHAEFIKDKEKYKAAFKGPRMDTYTHLISYIGWPDTGAIMRRLDDGKNTKDGKPGNMFMHLGNTEEERQMNLDIFRKWVGNWNLKRWLDVTKEDISSIKIIY